jgi:hypothetical protein
MKKYLTILAILAIVFIAIPTHATKVTTIKITPKTVTSKKFSANLKAMKLVASKFKAKYQFKGE